MKVAVVITVPYYTHSRNDLKGCEVDHAIMMSIVSEMGVVDVFESEKREKARDLKSRLAQWVDSIVQKGDPVEEVIFYFSGHGDLSDQLRLLLFDYEREKKNQTSISNNEIDDMLRNFGSPLVVKIVDACYSGTSYIKSMDELIAVASKSVEKSKQAFESCYFMFSSMSNQPSYQAKISLFTEAIAESLVEREGLSVRYKDLVDSVSDKFAGKDQTPFFVLQAKMTEIMICPSSRLVRLLGDILTEERKSIDVMSAGSRLRDVSKNFISGERFADIRDALAELMMAPVFSGESASVVDWVVEGVSVGDLPRVKELGHWISKRRDVFASPVTKNVERQVLKSNLRSLANQMNGTTTKNDFEVVVDHVIVSFKYTYEEPYLGPWCIRFHPREGYDALCPVSVFVVPVVSKSSLFVCVCAVTYKPSGWHSVEELSSCDWVMSQFLWGSVVDDLSVVVGFVVSYSEKVIEAEIGKVLKDDSMASAYDGYIISLEKLSTTGHP